MAISQLLLGVANSNLVGRKSKCYVIIKVSVLLSLRLSSKEIKPDAGKTTEKWVCCKFSLKRLPREADSDKTFMLLMNKHVCLMNRDSRSKQKQGKSFTMWQLNKALKLLSTLYCHKRNPVSLFHNILKTGDKLSFNAFGQLEDGGHLNATKTVRDLYKWICMITRLELLER